jgi:serine/threonine-protein phosphatase 4 regulatory subunit 1
MEILGELIHAFYDDPLGPPSELVEIYKDDSDEEEVFAGDCDWDIIAAYNVRPQNVAHLTVVPRCMPHTWL